VVKISNRLPVPKKLSRIVLTVLVYGVVGLLLALVLIRLVGTATNLVGGIPGWYERELYPMLENGYRWIEQIIQQLDPTVRDTVDAAAHAVGDALTDWITKFSQTAIGIVTGTAKAVPGVVIAVLVMIISTFFIALDYEVIMGFGEKHLPVVWKERIKRVWVYLTGTLFVVLRAYLLIMTLTFCELSVLFLIFKISNPFLKALGIAIFDILPVLGTGGIMIPWAVISFVTGKVAMGIKLVVIYGIVTVVRNYAEPKIVGTQLGLHPVVTLLSMFIGLRLFGVVGMMGFPITISYLWKQNQEAEAAGQKN